MDLQQDKPVMTPPAARPPQWLKIYDLWNDKPRIEATQHASLQVPNAGLVSEHGLFASEEWWQAISQGRIPRYVVEGYISPIQATGPSDVPQFHLVSPWGTTRWVWLGDMRYFVPGAAARIVYVPQKLNNPVEGTAVTNVVLEFFVAPPMFYAPAVAEAGEYPSVGQGIVLALMLLVAQLAAGGVLGIALGIAQQATHSGVQIGPVALACVAILAFAGALLWGLRIGKKSLREVATFSGFPLRVILPLILTAVGLSIVLSELDNITRWLLPVPNFLERMFSGGSPDALGHFFLLVIVAPVTEEIFFRGLMLRGFLKRYSARKSILVCSILFALVHVNPVQLIPAFCAGLLVCWLFARTHSLPLCILAHALYNGAVWAIVFAVKFEIPGYTGGPSPLTFQPWWFDLMGLVCLVLGAVGLGVTLLRPRSSGDDAGNDAGAPYPDDARV